MKKSFFKFIHVFLVISMMVWTFSPTMIALANTENAETVIETTSSILPAEQEVTEQTNLDVEPTVEPEITAPTTEVVTPAVIETIGEVTNIETANTTPAILEPEVIPAVENAAPIVTEPIPEITATEEIIPTETVATPIVVPEIWTNNGSKATTNNPVELNTTYTAPQNDQVKVTFTKLPETPGTFSIEEITLTSEQIKSLGALSDKAYDITSYMTDGSFAFDLTLPKPVNQENVQIKFAETPAELQNADTVSSSEVKSEIDSVSTSLDHFTIFFVTAAVPPICAVSINAPDGTSACYLTIQSAVNAALSGDTIIVSEGTYNLTQELDINKPISIIGQGSVTIKADSGSTWGTTNSTKHLINVFAGTSAKSVTFSNITFDSSNKSFGLQAYGNAYLVLNNVILKNSKGAGLTVNGSTVSVTNLSTNNNLWGSVNVDPGSGVITPSTFTLISGNLSEAKQIWSDGDHVTDIAKVDVTTGEGYNKYHITNNYILWTNKSLVDTNDATDITLTDATLQGTNGNFNATDHTFWVSLNTFVPALPVPAGIHSTPSLGPISAGVSFDPILLSSLTTNGTPSNLPTIAPNTTYYYVAWSKIGETWYPGEIKTFTTAPSVPTIPTNGTPNNSYEKTNDFYFNWDASIGSGVITYEFQSSLNPAQSNGVLTPGAWKSGILTGNTIHSTGAPDGTWYWQVRAINSIGEKSAWSPIWKMTIDSKIPTVAITAPSTNQVLKGNTVTIDGTATDSDFNYYYCFITNANGEIGTRDAKCQTAWWAGAPSKTAFAETANGTTNSHLGTITFSNSLPDGNYVVHLVAKDKVMNSAEATQSFILDNTRPSLSFVAPTNFSVPFKTGPIVSVHGSDVNGLSSLTIHLYNSSDVLQNKSCTATLAELKSGDLSCNLSGLADGTYYIKARENDNAGNNQTITSAHFIVDSIAPTITVKSDYIGNETAKIFSNVSFSLYDSNQVDKYVINSYVSDFSNNKWSDANFQNIKSHLVEGLNTFTLYDLAGNSTTYEFTYDSIAPTASFTHSNNNDDALVNTDVTSTLHAFEPIQTPVDWTKVDDITFTKLSSVNNKGNMNITDIAGNTRSIFFEVKRIDKTSPVFNISEGAILTTTSVEAIATEDNISNFIVDGVSTDYTGSKPNYKVTVTGEGSHIVVANDKAGNSSTVTFTIDTTAPVGGALTMKTKLFSNGVTNTLENNVYTITPALSMTGVDVFQSLSVVVNDNNLNTASVPAYIDNVKNGNMIYDAVAGVWNYSNQVGIPVFVAGPHTISATFADNAGNSTTLTANFTTDNTAPVGGTLTMKTKLFPDGVTNTLANNIYTVTPSLSLDGADVFNSLSVVVTDDNIDISNVPVYIDGNVTANGYMQYDSSAQVWNYSGQTTRPDFSMEKQHTLSATFKDLAGNQTILTANFTTDNTAPTVTKLSHDESAKTITYTFSEPMQLTNNDGTAITDGIANKLAVYQVTGLNYETATKVSDITKAEFAGNVWTLTYTGNLVAKDNTKYVVDAWGYRIADLAGNKMVSAENQMFTVIEQTAPTVTNLSHDESAKTITYTFSEPMQLVKQDTLAITPLDANLLGIHSVDTEGNYTNTKVDSITSATLTENVLTVTYSGTLPTGKYVVDAWGYNITDLASNKIIPDASQMFNVIVPIDIPASRSSFGGGGSSITYCSNVEYGEWGNAVNGIQERGILSRTPNSCSFTIEQISAASRTMPLPATQQVLGVKVYANGTLLKGGNNRIYVVIDNKLQYISSLKELIKYRSPILKVSDEVIASFRYTDGTLIRAKGDVKIYVIKDGKKVHIKSLAELRQYKGKTLTVEASELANY